MREQGFRLERLELPVTTSASTVVVDGLAVSEADGIILACEAKSGDNIEAKQAEKYRTMTAYDVRRLQSLRFPAQNVNVVPMYACLEPGATGIRRGLAAAGLECPVLVVGEGSVRLETPPESPVEAFEVDVDSPPPRIIVVDPESPDAEFEEVLIPEIAAAAAREEEVVPITSLLARGLPFWGVHGRDASGQLRRRAEAVLHDLSHGELRDYLKIERSGSDLEGSVVRIQRSPASFDPRGETQGWQRLRRRAEERLRGRRAPAPPAGQRSFEDLAREMMTEED